MESLKNMHKQILHNVEMVQDRSSKILQEQEKDLLRAFRARLFDVQVKGRGFVLSWRDHPKILRGIQSMVKKAFEAKRGCCLAEAGKTYSALFGGGRRKIFSVERLDFDILSRVIPSVEPTRNTMYRLRILCVNFPRQSRGV